MSKNVTDNDHWPEHKNETYEEEHTYVHWKSVWLKTDPSGAPENDNKCHISTDILNASTLTEKKNPKNYVQRNVQRTVHILNLWVLS